MALHLRDPEIAREWIAAGMELVRVPGDFDQVSLWVRTAGQECSSIPPVGMLMDIGRLLLGGRPVDAAGPRALAPVLRRYGDQILGRIAVHPLHEQARDALHSLTPDLVPVAIALVVEAMLTRIGFEGSEAVAPEALDDLMRVEEGHWAVRGASAVRAHSEEMGATYEALLACFARTSDAITAAEVTLLERLSSLRGRADRLALIQLVEASARLREGLPRTVRAGRRHSGHVPTITQDESSYPVGGFSSITTRGSMENLVPSELAGMEDGDEIDLFDVRYTENELLYYTRDESSFTRTTRHIFLVLDASIDRLRHRDKRLPWQTRILAFAFVRALALQLEGWLSAHELWITVVWPQDALAEDRRILDVALQQPQHNGWVRFASGDLTQEMTEAGMRAPTDVVTITAEDSPVITVEKTWSSVVRVHTPALRLPNGDAALPEDPWEAWRVLFDTVARDLV